MAQGDGDDSSVFKNAVDIMLFKGFKEAQDPTVAEKLKSIEIEEKQKEEHRKESEKSQQVSKLREKAVDETEVDHQIPSAAEIRNRTLQKIKANAEVAIKKEAGEIMKKALEAIEYAISDEKFSVDLGGPGRHDPGPVILKQALGNYSEDARKVVIKKLHEQGFKTQEMDDIFIRISW